VLDYPPGNKGTSCFRNVKRSRPCLHGLLSGQKEVSHNNGRKCKGSARREGTRVGVWACRCALSPRSRLTLVSLSSHSHRTLIALSSHPHLTLIPLWSHSHLTLVSLSCHSRLTFIPLFSFSSRSHPILISLSSHSHLNLIVISCSSRSHLTFISLSSRSCLTLISLISLSSDSHLIIDCSFNFWVVVWAMTQHRNTHIRYLAIIRCRLSSNDARPPPKT
jgi:hypothetical protein